jgi:hypothetical protein
MAMMCGECLDKKAEFVQLVNGVCPKCGTDYAATADVFNIPVKAKPGKKGK